MTLLTCQGCVVTLEGTFSHSSGPMNQQVIENMIDHQAQQVVTGYLGGYPPPPVLDVGQSEIFRHSYHGLMICYNLGILAVGGNSLLAQVRCP